MERPIILKAHEVRGILDGRQTQFRRIIKPTPPDGWSPTVFEYCPTCIDKHGEEYPGAPIFGASDQDFEVKCPFGQVGDRLWGRETFGFIPELEDAPGWQLTLTKGHNIVYRADKDIPNWELTKGWCSSAVMPRRAPRILLEIVSVRAERLQDISRADAIAHGATSRPNCAGYASRNEGWLLDWSRIGELSHFGRGYAFGNKEPLTERDICLTTPEYAVASMWLNDHGLLSWNANPWVWVVEFKRVDGA